MSLRGAKATKQSKNYQPTTIILNHVSFQHPSSNFLSFQKLFPAFHYIFCSASLRKRMPLQSGLRVFVCYFKQEIIINKIAIH
ncbi:hypothetical protein ACFP3I_03195 [Chryseobacterium arachidis]|uniref:hypothetical protein n=1 Tax=Chryseobacterium arachidis TaxID=1416778 RepID=UPI00361E2573